MMCALREVHSDGWMSPKLRTIEKYCNALCLLFLFSSLVFSSPSTPSSLSVLLFFLFSLFLSFLSLWSLPETRR